MMTLFDKQIQLRMGQANVKRWVDDIMPLLTDDDPLGVETFATHRLPLDEAPHAYETSRRSRTAWSRSCSSPDRVPGCHGPIRGRPSSTLSSITAKQPVRIHPARAPAGARHRRPCARGAGAGAVP